MAKHKYIESPERMWELFTLYRDEVKSNPRKKMVFGGKDFTSDLKVVAGWNVPAPTSKS